MATSVSQSLVQARNGLRTLSSGRGWEAKGVVRLPDVAQARSVRQGNLHALGRAANGWLLSRGGEVPTACSLWQREACNPGTCGICGGSTRRGAALPGHASDRSCRARIRGHRSQICGWPGSRSRSSGTESPAGRWSATAERGTGGRIRSAAGSQVRSTRFWSALAGGKGRSSGGSGVSAQALQGQDAWHGRLWRRASESRRRRCSGFRPTGRVRMIMVRTKGPQHSDSGVQIWKTSTMQDLNGVFGEQSGYQEGFGWSLIQYRERSAGTTVDREVALLKSGIDEIEGDLRQTGHASEGCHTDRRSLPMSNKVFVVGSRTRRIGERSDCAIARRTGTGAGDPARVTDISRAERSSRSSRTTGMSDLPWSY